ncbi:hypothetical protein Syun_013968 [Stephania yunnanensis]|uniref:Peroxidase n=1 Tax=Stephania yunnanensis TaxID=152371 RepID=A0AAP0JID4_9MAGN
MALIPTLAAIFIACTFMGSHNSVTAQLAFGFYSSTCPKAEQIVSSVVQQSVQANSRMAAILLRLHFHDCFVQGCDGSILIEGDKAEKHAFGHQGVQGFDVIETAKAQLESECRGVVSCADIVAMAARDAVALDLILPDDAEWRTGLSGSDGRRDGLTSTTSSADDMPEVTESIEQLKNKFIQKGLSVKDFVLLNAAHTIGTTACFFMTNRLYNFPDGTSDPTINPAFLPELEATCPKDGDVNVRLAADRESELKFDDSILRNIRNGFAVLESDAKLYTDAETISVVDSYVSPLNFLTGPNFGADFAESMVNMGMIDVKTGSQGQIRRVCSAFN